MRKHASFFLFFTLVIAALFVPAFAEDHSYRLRGSGENLRKEGLAKETAGAHFSLLSVMRGELRLQQIKPSLLAIKFFMPEQATAYLRVREKVNLKTYKLDAVNTVWSSGWNTFGSWSADEVIHQQGVSIGNLGVTVTQRTTPHASGMVYPAILVDGTVTDGAPNFNLSSLYSFIVKSNTGLEPLKWGLYKLHQDGQQTKLSNQEFYIEKLAAGMPFEISIDTSGLGEGVYKLKMRGEYVTAGYSKVVKKNYTFFHKLN